MMALAVGVTCTGMTIVDHNEVLLRGVLRVYRNEVLKHLRSRLKSAFGEKAIDQVAALYQRIDPRTNNTMWQSMQANAERARSTPEVSTRLADEFDALGVADFHGVFEKHFETLDPSIADLGEAARKERKKGVLRCLMQVKIQRDPASHEVTEDIGDESLLLCMQNAIIILQYIGAEGAIQELKRLRREVIQRGAVTKRAVWITFAKDHSFDGMEGALRAQKVELRSHCVAGPVFDIARCLEDVQHTANVVIAFESPDVTADGPLWDRLRSVIESAFHCGANVVPLLRIGESLKLPNSKPSYKRLVELRPVSFHAEFMAESAARIERRLKVATRMMVAAGNAFSRMPVASVIYGEQLQTEILKELYSTQLDFVCLICPWLTDLQGWPWPSTNLSGLLASRSTDGVRIRVVTRPPKSDEDPVSKSALLDTLERNGIEVLVNPLLHAKVFLFESSPDRRRWIIGSHNLTANATKRWLEASMAGYRKPEYEEAWSVSRRIDSLASTEPYYIWKAKEAKAAAQRQLRAEKGS